MSNTAERRKLSANPNWLTGIVIDDLASGTSVLRCRQCRETLTVVDDGDSLWVLGDVARDHRMFCRDDEETP